MLLLTQLTADEGLCNSKRQMRGEEDIIEVVEDRWATPVMKRKSSITHEP